MACLRATGQMCQHLPKQRTPSTPCSLRSSRLLPSRSSLPLVPQPSLAHRSTAHKPQRQQTRAFPEGIDGFITTVALATGAVGVLAYFLSAPASDDVPAQGESDDNFKWGVMGVIGCIPLVNWTAWIFGALDITGEPNPRASSYYFYAALYALPLLRSGFDQDSFSIGMLLLGIAHLQVERMAVTEPDQLEELAAQLSITKALKAGATRLLETAKWTPVQKVLKEGERRTKQDLEDSKALQREEMRRFDEQLQQKDRRQRGRRLDSDDSDDSGW